MFNVQSPTDRMHSLEYESQLVETLLELFAAQYRIQPLIRAALCALCRLYSVPSAVSILVCVACFRTHSHIPHIKRLFLRCLMLLLM